jgi:hypothetical protein
MGGRVDGTRVGLNAIVFGVAPVELEKGSAPGADLEAANGVTGVGIVWVRWEWHPVTVRAEDKVRSVRSGAYAGNIDPDQYRARLAASEASCGVNVDSV